MRKTVDVKVPEFPGTSNRDRNKLFRITEWSASRAEKWGLRMILAANTGGGALPLNLSGIGMEGIAILGINTFLRGSIGDQTLIPLLDELLDCVEIVRDQSHPATATKIVSDDDIEEVATRMWLRGEVLTLHLGFSVSATLSALYSKIMIYQPPPSTESPTQ